MKALVIGGTGVIGAGVVKHLLQRGASVTAFSRGKHRLAGVRHLAGDRWDGAAFEALSAPLYDVVFDLMCFSEADASETARVFGGKTAHVVLCSTVCVYGTNLPQRGLVDESFVPDGASPYGLHKWAAERALLRAGEAGLFGVTVIRPSHTYGAGGPMLDQLEIHGIAWDRVERGLPIFCADDGLGAWQATHRDDVGKLFAHAALNEKTYGEAYNATSETTLTWREYHQTVAAALGRTVRFVFAPAEWLLTELPDHSSFLRETSRFPGAYSSAKARTDVPAFTCETSLVDGAKETLSALKMRDGRDAKYDAAVERALVLGYQEA